MRVSFISNNDEAYDATAAEDDDYDDDGGCGGCDDDNDYSVDYYWNKKSRNLRKLMTCTNIYHLNADGDHFYIARSNGGKCLM